MTVIVCVSDGGGMLFNNRRQSKDATVLKDIRELVGNRRLLISPFSAKLFSEGVTVSDSPLALAKGDELVFVENLALRPYFDKVDTLIIYKWNRAYPFDHALDIDTEKEGMTLVESVDFVGSSHEKITREIWEKCQK